MSIVKQRQDPLRQRYRHAAQEARIRDSARTVGSDALDPFHGSVEAGEKHGRPWPFGIHRAVGGYHDLPNPGDLLCAAVAACLDATLRIVANRLGIRLAALEVAVSADVDVRGTLLVDRTVPVGFQEMECRVRLEPAVSTDADTLQMLVAAAEHSCVVLQTLRAGLPVVTHLETSNALANG